MLLEYVSHLVIIFRASSLKDNTDLRMMSQHENSSLFLVIIHSSTTSRPLAEMCSKWSNMSPLSLTYVILWVIVQCRRSTVSLLKKDKVLKMPPCLRCGYTIVCGSYLYKWHLNIGRLLTFLPLLVSKENAFTVEADTS